MLIAKTDEKEFVTQATADISNAKDMSALLQLLPARPASFARAVRQITSDMEGIEAIHWDPQTRKAFYVSVFHAGKVVLFIFGNIDSARAADKLKATIHELILETAKSNGPKINLTDICIAAYADVCKMWPRQLDAMLPGIDMAVRRRLKEG